MIAIPNMDKPNCQKCIEDCLNIPLDCYPDEYGENRKGEKIVCPLIEIVRCKDCKYVGKTDADWVCNGGFEIDCGDPYVGGQAIVHPLDFCSYGERNLKNNSN